MKSIQHFELDPNRAARYDADVDCCVRVTSGRVWLTTAGLSIDVWLDAGAEHAIASGGVVWMSAEPKASIVIVRHTKLNAARRANPATLWKRLARAGGLLPARCNASIGWDAAF